MPERSLTLQLPELLAEELRSAHQDFLLEILERGLRELRIERALALYARSGMTFGAAAEQAGVSQGELARQAYARGLEPPFSSETLSEELGRPA
jgi:predicted HTH domain antitoxin